LNVPGVEYTSPRTFTLRQRLTLAIAPQLCALIIRAIALTFRTEIRNEHCYQRVIDEHGHVIVALWHEAILMGLWRYRDRGTHSMTSYSYDGELAARIIRPFGARAVRGSTSEGGSGALRELEKALPHIESVALTPDGPRGPRRVAQVGTAILAARTQIPIIPHAAAATPAWRLRSWDRFTIPKPFARIVHVYGEPIPPPPNESREAIESVRSQMDYALNKLHRELEDELGLEIFHQE